MLKVRIAAIATVLLVLGGNVLNASPLINGAGASFPAPLYAKWFADYQKIHPDVHINYQSIGSGGGIRQFVDHTVDFGASDAPMTDAQLKAASGEVVHIPTVAGAVVLTYQLPELKEKLKLSSDVIADIFLGKITKWNDGRITALNPGLSSTDQPITVVHRSDGSGTTNIFTDYLAKVSAEWKTRVGVNTSVDWPVKGLGGKGNEGVTGQIKQTPFSIGYVELIYAESNHLPYATVKNRAGQFVAPSLSSVTAAVKSAKIPDDFRASLTDPSGKEAYPISGLTYLLVWKNQPDAEKGEALKKFFQWALKDGQKEASALFYAPLPDSVAKRALKAAANLKLAKSASSR